MLFHSYDKRPGRSNLREKRINWLMITKGKLGAALSVVEEACGVGNRWSQEPVVAGAALSTVSSLPTW